MSSKTLKSLGYDPDYHDRQFVVPYQSTISFCDWLVSLGAIGQEALDVCDMGCGKGANLQYMARRFPKSNFYGIDIDEEVISEGRNTLLNNSISNVEMIAGDLHLADAVFERRKFDGIVSLQTLSWLSSYEKALDAFIKLAPKWIALTSLFYDGLIEAKTVISEFETDASGGKLRRSLPYNTYSLPLVKKYFSNGGYSRFMYHRFEMPMDLPKVDGRMGTYTEKTADGRLLQISGPLLMNWYFIFARAD